MKCRLLASLIVLGGSLLFGLGETHFGLVSGILAVGLAVKRLCGMEKADFDAFKNAYQVFDNPNMNEEDERKINSYYKVLMPLLELGGLSKFYIPPLMDPSRASFRHLQIQQEMFERKMAEALSLGQGKSALDIGCGQGLIADLVQEHTGARVVGFNISPEQIEQARKNAKRKGKLGTLLDFDIGSMNDDPFPYPENSFDAVYAVQTLPYAHNLTNMMREVRRVLKPGGIFSSVDVVSMQNYNPNNKTQFRMAQRARRVGAIPLWRTVQDHENAYTANGLHVKFSQHLPNEDLLQAAKDYFNPLGDIMNFLHKVGLVGKPMMASMDQMNEYGMDLIHGERERLFTTNYWILAQG